MTEGQLQAGRTTASVVLPCLNEAAGLRRTLASARELFSACDLAGEIIVADNGSDDASVEIATAAGATVVHVPERGYGCATRAGLAACRGELLLIADADGTYDLREGERLIAALRNGADLVIGNRFQGDIEPFAMPFSHRYLGNPALSALGRLFSGASVGDFHAGMRGLTRAAHDKLKLQGTGMELASEMILVAARCGLRIREVPITLDNRAPGSASHLRPWSDAWRHLRCMWRLRPAWAVPYLLLAYTLGLLAAFVLGTGTEAAPTPPDAMQRLRLEPGELILTALAATVGAPLLTAIHWRGWWLGRLCRVVAHNRGLAALLIALSAVGGAWGVAQLNGWPVPQIHDEFCYLLTADTFAAGRLTNPTPALWRFFESPHLFLEPTYAAKYPPAQAVFMAAGQLATGEPIVGVWLAAGLALAAFYWLLLAWTRRRWALAGALLVTIGLGATGYWNQGYWGGWVPFIGGALVFGASRRLRGPGAGPQCLVWAVGVVVLMTSRPFEGLIVTVPTGLFVLARVLRGRHWGYAAGAAVLLAVAAAGMLHYNRAVTGDAWTLPYTHQRSLYAATEPFLVGTPPAPPYYRHANLARFYEWERQGFEAQQTVSGLLRTKWAQLRELWIFFLGVVLTLPLLTSLIRTRDFWSRAGALVLLLFFAALRFETWIQPHYAAPAAPLFLALSIRGLRRWTLLHDGAGRLAAFWLALVVCASTAVEVVGRQGPGPERAPWAARRAEITSVLSELDGRHLIFVTYAEGHEPFAEWVYNAADLEGAAVIWAHDLGPDENEALIATLRGRRVWRLRASEPPWELEIYGAEPSRSSR